MITGVSHFFICICNVRSISDQSIADSSSSNIIGGSHYLCQEFVYWLGEGGREERKKERQDSLVYRLGITIEFLTTIQSIRSVETGVPGEKGLQVKLGETGEHKTSFSHTHKNRSKLERFDND